MKKFLLLLAIAGSCFSNALNAQTPTYSKGGGTSNSTFLLGSTSARKTQCIYLPSDISPTPPAGQQITKLYFRYGTTGNTTPQTLGDFQVNLGQTTQTVFSPTTTTFFTGLTNVIPLTTSYTIPAGTTGNWFEIPLTTPFNYDPTQTLILEVKFETSATTLGTYSSTFSGRKVYSSSTTAATGTTTTSWQDIGFDLGFGAPCTNPPTAGNAVSTDSFICALKRFSLSLTGNTAGAGQTYQWQSSTDSTNWFDIAGKTSTTLDTFQTATTNYRVIVTCGASDTSTVVKVVNDNNQLNGTYTINKTLPTGSGNFNSFADAVTALDCGISGPVTFNVVAGTGPYNEQFSLREIAGASSVNRITFNGNGDTLQFTPVAANNYVVRLDSADYITIKNFYIRNLSATTGMGIFLTNLAQYDSILNNTIDLRAVTATGTVSGCIVASGLQTNVTTDGNALSNCAIIGNRTIAGYTGIYINGASVANPSLGNVIANNIVTDFYIYGIYCDNTNGTLVKGNDVSRPNPNTFTTFYGIYIAGLGDNVVVDANKIHDPTTGNLGNTSVIYCIYNVDDAGLTTPATVSNNIIYKIESNTSSQYGIYNSSANNYRYYHNTVVLDDANSTSGLAYAFYQTTTATGIDIQNNVFVVSRGGTGTKTCVRMNTSGTLFTSNNNVFSNTAPAATTKEIFYFVSSYPTLTSWQASNLNAYDQNSIEANPQFTDASTGNLVPINPALNNIGNDTLGIINDYTGATRGALPDPGAFEFTPVPTDAGISAINNPGANALTGTDSLKVTIGNFGTTPITSVTVYYTVNGVLRAPFVYSDTIASGGNSGAVALDTITLFEGANTIVVWTSNPNGSADAVNGNDTLTLTVNACVGLAGNYIINKTQPTAGNNFNSFADAAAALSCGITAAVTFNVASGTGPYNEQFSLNEILGASATNRITFNGNGETIEFTPVVTNNYIVSLNGTDFVTIKNFNFKNLSDTRGIGVFMTNLAEYDSILNNTFDFKLLTTSSTASGCIVASSSQTNVTSDGNSISNCAIIGNTTKGAYAGIILNGQSSTVQSPNNTIANNIVEDFFIYGILTDHVVNTKFLNNDISRKNATNYTNSFYGIWLSGSAAGCEVSGNKIHDSQTSNPGSAEIAYGIYTSGDGTISARNTVSNNIVYNFNSTTAAQYGIYNSGGDYYNYYHNTIVLDNAASTAGITYAFYQTITATGIVLQNNIFYVSRGGSGIKTCVRMNTAATSFTSNNNVFYNGAPAATTKEIFYYTTGYQTLALWQASNLNAYDQNSVEANPNFANTSSGALLPSNLLVNNTGIDTLGITTDITGSTRGTIPDAGAFEFEPLNKDLSAFAVSVPSIFGCFKTNEVVRVSVRNSGLSTWDFSVDSLVVTVVSSGAGSSSVDTVIKTGTLATDSVLTFNIFSGLNISALGTHVITLIAKGNGDQLAASDTASITLFNPLAVPIPDSVNFTGFTGTNLSTFFPNWREATGALMPGGTTSSWTSQTGLGGTGNITARVNLFGATKNEWIVGPKFIPGAVDVLSFDAAVTNWNNIVDADVMGSDDTVSVMLSLDCGVSWQPIYNFTASDNLTPVLTNFSVPLGTYAGQQIYLAFKATEGTVDDLEEYDFHLDNIFIKTPAAKELAMQAITSPTATGCYGANEPVEVRIVNSGSQPFNFANDSAVVTVTVAGAVTQSYTTTINTGILNPAATLTIPLGNIDMTTVGTYNFTAIVKGNGDDLAKNDTLKIVRIQTPTAAIPDSVSFTGFTGANLSTAFPRWREGAGVNTPIGTTSSWLSQSGVGATGNITARVNLLSALKNEWIVGPKFLPTATDYVVFDAAVTNKNITSGNATMGSDDAVQLMVSTDCGASWQSAFTINQNNAPSSTLTRFFVPLSAYAGQPAIFAFKATDGPVDDLEDYDFHLDNIYIGKPAFVDAKAESFVSPQSGCGSDSSEVRIVVSNNGVSPVVNLQVNALISGTLNTTLSNTLTDTLFAGERTVVTVGYFNSANGGTFNVKAFTSLPNDERADNDSISRTVVLDSILFAPQINDTTICVGDNIDLVIPTLLEVAWYDADGDSLLSTGNVLNVAPAATTTYRYQTIDVSAVNYNVGYTVAPTADLISSTIDYGIRFNANNDFVLNSVVMYPTGTGTITLAVKDDATEAVLFTSQPIAISDGGVPRSAVTVPVGLNIPAGQNYRLTLLSYTGITTLGRAGSGVTGFPFATPNNELVLTYSSTGTPGSTGTTTYNWFYNWNVTVSTGNCPSPLKYVTVKVSDYPVIDSFTVTDAKCFGAAGGAIDISVSGGIAPFTHSWSNGATTEDLSAVLAGTYTDTVRNAAGCAVVSQPIVVSQPASAVTAVATAGDVLCAGDVNGTASLSVTGGTPNYSIEWSNDSTGLNLTGLAPGVYNATITDANGCTTLVSDTVKEPSAISATSVATDQVGNTNGSIDVTVSGGTPGYTYSWTNNATTQDITAAAGAYTLTISDANGCTFVIADTIDFISGIGAVESGIRKINMYPNPTSGVANIAVELNKAMDVVIEVYDVSGRLLTDLRRTDVTIENIQLDLSSFAAGMYHVRVHIAGETFTRQLVLQR